MTIQQGQYPDEQGNVPYIEDETGLKSTIITPHSQLSFDNISRDIVLSNFDKQDVEFVRATQNIIMVIRSLANTPQIRAEINRDFPDGKTHFGYFDRVIESFVSEVAILANSQRALDMRQAELLHTNISKISKKVRTGGESKTGQFFKGEERDEYA